jgi:signal transduction histidine kinase
MLATIQPEERLAIHSRWTSVTYEHATDYALIWRIVLGALAVFAIVIYWNRRLKKEVTERKRAEARADKMLEVVARNLKDLQESHEAQEALIQETSHDFRTPLMSIGAIVQNLNDHRERHTPEQFARSLVTVRSEIDYMSRLIESLLFISNISLQDTSSEEMDLGELVEYECGAIPRRGRDVSFKPAPGILVAANDNLVRRMVKNLLDNAVKNAETEVCVTLLADEQLIRLTVTNDGNEIADKAQYGLKSRKRKVDKSNGIYISMGLGSIIIRKIVEKYDGHIDLSDREGGGAIITVAIPMDSCRVAGAGVLDQLPSADEMTAEADA